MMELTGVWRRLYETNPAYRQAWDEGRGPGQPKTPLRHATLQRRLQDDKTGDVPRPEYQRRLRQCDRCDHYRDGECWHEGAIMPLAANLFRAAFQCPAGLWPDSISPVRTRRCGGC